MYRSFFYFASGNLDIIRIAQFGSIDPNPVTPVFYRIVREILTVNLRDLLQTPPSPPKKREKNKNN
jgi:hypothetical protein